MLAGDPETQGQFLAAVRAAGIFLAGRERSKTTVIKFVHESRLAFTELGKRMVEAGVFDHVEDFGLLANAEYDDFLADPASFRDTIRERASCTTACRASSRRSSSTAASRPSTSGSRGDPRRCRWRPRATCWPAFPAAPASTPGRRE